MILVCSALLWSAVLMCFWNWDVIFHECVAPNGKCIDEPGILTVFAEHSPIFIVDTWKYLGPFWFKFFSFEAGRHMISFW